MGKGLRELATKEKLGGKSDEALTVTKINELQKYYRIAIVNNTYDLKSMQDAIQASLYHCSSTYERPAGADVQRVLHHGAFLIKENETDKREYWHPKILEKLYCAEKAKQAKHTGYRAGEH